MKRHRISPDYPISFIFLTLMYLTNPNTCAKFQITLAEVPKTWGDSARAPLSIAFVKVRSSMSDHQCSICIVRYVFHNELTFLYYETEIDNVYSTLQFNYEI